jgi:hypothetical protein
MESDQSLGIEGERARVSRKFGMSELSRQKPPGGPSLPPLIASDEKRPGRKRPAGLEDPENQKHNDDEDNDSWDDDAGEREC